MWKDFNTDLIRRDVVFGAQQRRNLSLGRRLFIGGIRFVTIGIFSWDEIRNFFSIIEFTNIQFIPQGRLICFYGSRAILFGIYICSRAIWSVGRGFNEYNKKTGQIRMFRLGFPGPSRESDTLYSFSDLESLVLMSQARFVVPKTLNLYLVLKGPRKVLLTPINAVETYDPKKIENFAAELRQFLQIPLNEISSMDIHYTCN